MRTVSQHTKRKFHLLLTHKKLFQEMCMTQMYQTFMMTAVLNYSTLS